MRYSTVFKSQFEQSAWQRCTISSCPACSNAYFFWNSSI